MHPAFEREERKGERETSNRLLKTSRAAGNARWHAAWNKKPPLPDHRQQKRPSATLQPQPLPEWGDIGAPGEKGEAPALSAHVRDRFRKRMSNGIKQASQSGTVLPLGSSRVQAIPTSLHTPGAAAPLLTIIEAEICDK